MFALNSEISILSSHQRAAVETKYKMSPAESCTAVVAVTTSSPKVVIRIQELVNIALVAGIFNYRKIGPSTTYVHVQVFIQVAHIVEWFGVIMHAVVAGDSCGHGVNMMGIGHLNSVENLNQIRTDRRTVELRFSWEGVLNHTWISQKEIYHICIYEWRNQCISEYMFDCWISTF